MSVDNTVEEPSEELLKKLSENQSVEWLLSKAFEVFESNPDQLNDLLSMSEKLQEDPEGIDPGFLAQMAQLLNVSQSELHDKVSDIVETIIDEQDHEEES